jgi:hypothetical protein
MLCRNLLNNSFISCKLELTIIQDKITASRCLLNFHQYRFNDFWKVFVL